MPDNYYDELLKSVNRAMAEENYQQASRLIDDELAMPYVPETVMGQLESLKRDLAGKLTAEKRQVIMSPEEVYESLFSDSESAYLALNYLKKANIRQYLGVIKDYLGSEDGNEMISSLLLELCHDQQIHDELTVLKRGKIQKVIPAELGNVLDDRGFQDSWQFLRDLLENDNPSFLQQCQQVLIQYAYKRYPEPLDNSNGRLALGVVRYVFEAYNDTEGFEKLCRQLDVDKESAEKIVI